MKTEKTSKSQYLNVLKIDEMIRNKIYPSVKKITHELELSERQVLRIIRDIKVNYKASIEYDREKKGYCYLLDGFSIADISLNEDETFALEVCHSFITRVFGGSKIYNRLKKGLLSLQNRAEKHRRRQNDSEKHTFRFLSSCKEKRYEKELQPFPRQSQGWQIQSYHHGL